MYDLARRDDWLVPIKRAISLEPDAVRSSTKPEVARPAFETPMEHHW
jgi:hypothetical protein